MTAEQLQEIERFAGLAFKPEQVAVIVEISVKEFADALENPEHEIYRAYYRGFYKREAELRTVVFEQALSGSTPAQMVANTYIDNLKLDLMK